jgi:hypothetical protein
VVCEPLHQGVIGPLPLPDAAWINRPEAEKITDDTDLKRRWGMAGTKSIEIGVEVMPHRSAVDSMLSGAICTDSFDTNQMKGDIGQKNIDKKATTFLTTTASLILRALACFRLFLDAKPPSKAALSG